MSQCSFWVWWCKSLVVSCFLLKCPWFPQVKAVVSKHARREPGRMDDDAEGPWSETLSQNGAWVLYHWIVIIFILSWNSAAVGFLNHDFHLRVCNFNSGIISLQRHDPGPGQAEGGLVPSVDFRVTAHLREALHAEALPREVWVCEKEGCLWWLK